jgi:hypothetical protein
MSGAQRRRRPSTRIAYAGEDLHLSLAEGRTVPLRGYLLGVDGSIEGIAGDDRMP